MSEFCNLLIPIITVLGMFLANAALIIPLFLWNRAESRADIRQMDCKIETIRTESSAFLKAIQDEMKDFHTKLANQDLEFKMKMAAIEERARK